MNEIITQFLGGFMYTLKKLSTIIAFIFFSLPVNAAVTITDTNSFNTVSKITNSINQKYGSNKVLVVFDIDNTLLTTGKSDLGGDIWYQWQTDKLLIKPNEGQKVKCLYSDTIPMLYQLLPMTLTEPTVKKLINQLKTNNNTFFALSSRGNETRSATIRELNKYGLDFSKNSLAPQGSKQAPVYFKTLNRPTAYLNGVALTSGVNKGQYIDFLLDKTERKFDALIFVDDGQHNIDTVNETFSSDKYSNMDTQLIHYTKIVNDRIKKNGAVLTQPQAVKMDQDWKALETTLNTIYPERTEGCLSH
ncbi:DUF2608 domain-containing protein [Vibrio mediterranei]|uniref:DUF2608 domain-containing protein n=1 Tax=Vibrio mediterranei TaxID=689 RepID=UPI002284FF72|nr:DUF2608 domain-containing protein [Vibrio mediterranei]MCY9855868.1 DUF2608 domain-containing protein [Vibrio mediterranei]